jgi:hypothetical protein
MSDAGGLPLDLDQIESRAEAATPGPWKTWAMQVLADPVGDSNLDTALLIARTTDPHRGLRTFNADFIAAARTDVPALVARVRALEAEVQQLRKRVNVCSAGTTGCIVDHEKVGGWCSDGLGSTEGVGVPLPIYERDL